MKKRMLCLLLGLTLVLGATAQAADTEATTAAVIVDGVTMEHFAAAGYDKTTYASLYGMTLALRPDAVITWEDNQMVARAEDFTISARIGASYMVVNDRYLYIPGGVKSDAVGDTLVPTRTMAAALGATVAWNNGAVEFTSGGTPLISGEQFYNTEDVDLLARVITHESGNQPLTGKIAVGNVILNRTKDSRFADTISGVIYQKGQFPGATNATPNAESIIAAKLCLDGAVTVPNALYFNGAGKACWASRNRTLLATIGGHAFYG